MDLRGKNWNLIRNAVKFTGQLHNDDIIGEGSYGVVFRYKDDTGNLVAVKRISLQKDIDKYETSPKGIENIDLLLTLNNTNIVRLLNVMRDVDKIYLLMELMDGGNLKELIEENKQNGTKFPLNCAMPYTGQILRGLEYLHSRQIVHRDIKPRNIMLNKQGTEIKLTDFGTSTLLSTTSGTKTSSVTGTWLYMAPELICWSRCSYKSDIWSLGVTLIELLCGITPFSQSATPTALLTQFYVLDKKQRKPNYDLSGVVNDTDEVNQIVDKMLQPRPENRPTATELITLYYPLLFAMDGSDHESEYKLNKHYKGRALIINNVMYVNDESRDGSHTDANRLKNLLNAIGFPALKKNDQDASEIMASINAFVKDKINKKFSSVILIFLAHGTEQGLLGKDHKIVTWKEILNAFSPENAPLLLRKPKILIIQACRGSAWDRAHPKFETFRSKAETFVCSTDFDNSDEKTERTHNKARPNSISTEVRDFSGSDEELDLFDFASSKSDILVAHSTTSGNYSFRKKGYDGSFFIQSLCNAIQSNWKKKSLLDILTIASGEVSKSTYQQLGESFVQTCEVRQSLRGIFYLSRQEERISEEERNQRLLAKEKALLISVGGRLKLETCTDVSIYDCNTNSWQAAAPTKSGRSYAAAVTWNGTVVVAGGDLPMTDSVEQFDPQTNTWTALPNLLAARGYHSLVNLDGGLYVIGGWDGKQALGSVELYDTKTETWTNQPTLSTARRNLACALCARGFVASGGIDKDNIVLSSCELYDTAVCQWSRIAPLNIPRFSHAAAMHNFTVYVFGGRARDRPRAEIEQYDADADKWTLLKARLSRARYELAAACVHSCIYILGGRVDGNNEKQEVPTELDVIDVFDTEKKQCERVLKLPQARRAHAVVLQCL